MDQFVTSGDTAQLDGSGSDDPDMDPLAYAWQLVSVPAGSVAALSDATLVNPTFVADLAGDYVLQLVVNDGTVDSASDQMTVSAQSPPVAYAGVDQRLFIDNTVQLDGSASSDPDLDPLTYAWQLMSAPIGSNSVLSDASLVNPTFVADLAGDYVLQLVVSDGMADSAPDQVTITAQTAAEAAEEVIESIDDLVDQGVLNGGQGNALEAKLALDEAIEELGNGQINAALNKLGAFINQVNGMVTAGELTQEEAQPLLDAVNAIIAHLGG